MLDFEMDNLKSAKINLDWLFVSPANQKVTNPESIARATIYFL